MLKTTGERQYVYTLGAAEARLRRGAVEVLLFWPGSGELVSCTKTTLPDIRQRWRALAKKTD